MKSLNKCCAFTFLLNSIINYLANAECQIGIYRIISKFAIMFYNKRFSYFIKYECGNFMSITVNILRYLLHLFLYTFFRYSIRFLQILVQVF